MQRIPDQTYSLQIHQQYADDRAFIQLRLMLKHYSDLFSPTIAPKVCLTHNLMVMSSYYYFNSLETQVRASTSFPGPDAMNGLQAGIYKLVNTSVFFKSLKVTCLV